MSHIASDKFYLSVQKNISKSLSDGFILYFEGVRPGSPENMEAFNEALGIDFSPTLYDNFSKLYGLSSQDNDMFLWLGPQRDKNIDLDIDTIMELYREKKNTSDTKNNLWEVAQIVDIEEEFVTLLSVLKPRELKVLQYLNQWMLNFFMKQETLQALLLEQAGSDIFSVILRDRDEFIARSITESPEKKIFALYGKLHFEGVLKALQEDNPRWKIESVEYMQVIR